MYEKYWCVYVPLSSLSEPTGLQVSESPLGFTTTRGKLKGWDLKSKVGSWLAFSKRVEPFLRFESGKRSSGTRCITSVVTTLIGSKRLRNTRIRNQKHRHCTRLKQKLPSYLDPKLMTLTLMSWFVSMLIPSLVAVCSFLAVKKSV